MARGPAVAVVGLGNVMRALREVDRSAPREMRRGIAAELEPIRLKAHAKMKVGPGPTSGGGDNPLPHIRDTLRARARGNRGVIEATHPGAGVMDWGGTIAPRGTPISFARREDVYSTVAEHREVIARRVRETVERVGRSYGL